MSSGRMPSWPGTRWSARCRSRRATRGDHRWEPAVRLGRQGREHEGPRRRGGRHEDRRQLDARCDPSGFVFERRTLRWGHGQGPNPGAPASDLHDVDGLVVGIRARRPASASGLARALGRGALPAPEQLQRRHAHGWGQGTRSSPFDRGRAARQSGSGATSPSPARDSRRLRPNVGQCGQLRLVQVLGEFNLADLVAEVGLPLLNGQVSAVCIHNYLYW